MATAVCKSGVPFAPWVHGDEETDSGVQADGAAVGEHEGLLALPDGRQDAVDLEWKRVGQQTSMSNKG